MPRKVYNYICTVCGVRPAESDMEAKAMLTAKVVFFRFLGNHQPNKKGVTAGWLCRDCLLKDEDFLRERWVPPYREIRTTEEIEQGNI